MRNTECFNHSIDGFVGIALAGGLSSHPDGQYADQPLESLRRGLLGVATRGGNQLAAELSRRELFDSLS